MENKYISLNKEVFSQAELLDIIAELRLHQEELESQNHYLLQLQQELDNSNKRYYELYDEAPVAYVEIDESGTIIETNTTFQYLLGLESRPSKGAKLSSYIFAQDQDIFYSLKRELKLCNMITPTELRLKHVKNHYIWVNIKATCVKISNGCIFRMALFDSTLRHMAEKALSESEEKFRLVCASMNQGLALFELIYDYTGAAVDALTIEINNSFTKLMGLNECETIGKKISEILPFLRGNSLDKYAQVAISGNGIQEEIYDDDSGLYLLRYIFSPKRHQFAILISDITERVLDNKQRDYMTYHDQLTGLYNRVYFEKELKRIDVPSNLPITLVIGDINGLKMVNDSFGHAEGDTLLKSVAAILTEGCRSHDVISRIGGDEFIIILPKTNGDITDQVITRIKGLLNNKNCGCITLSVSFGHYTKVSESESIYEILKRSEDKMYQQKLCGSASIKSKMVDIIMNSLVEKNHREMLHSKRVSAICEIFATKLSFTQENTNLLRMAGLMHDIGKFGIPDHILNSKEPLSEHERNIIKRHSEIGHRILSSSTDFSQISTFILEHHERWDGKGYPKGLRGDEISVGARMITISDAYDAMTHERSYRIVLSREDALQEIETNSGTQFDPNMVDVFLNEVVQYIL